MQSSIGKGEGSDQTFLHCCTEALASAVSGHLGNWVNKAARESQSIFRLPISERSATSPQSKHWQLPVLPYLVRCHRVCIGFHYCKWQKGAGDNGSCIASMSPAVGQLPPFLSLIFSSLPFSHLFLPSLFFFLSLLPALFLFPHTAVPSAPQSHNVTRLSQQFILVSRSPTDWPDGILKDYEVRAVVGLSGQLFTNKTVPVSISRLRTCVTQSLDCTTQSRDWANIYT